MYLKSNVFDQFVLPMLTMDTNEGETSKLRVTQREMERAMLGVSLRKNKRKNWIRDNTKVKVVI